MSRIRTANKELPPDLGPAHGTVSAGSYHVVPGFVRTALLSERYFSWVKGSGECGRLTKEEGKEGGVWKGVEEEERRFLTDVTP